jgi:hypothetical protein
MFAPIILSVGVFYAVVGAVIVQRVRKPTCRVCLLRQFCPNRKREHLKSRGKPCWSRDQPTE